MLEKTRILLLSTAYLPQIGGSELAIKNITDRLPGISFDLITSRPSKKIPAFEKIGNVNVYRTGGWLGLFSFLLPKNFLPIPIFLKARQLIRENGSYDVVHAYQASQAAGGGWLLKWVYPQIPFLLTVQEGKPLGQQPWLLRVFRRFIFKKINAATAISNYLAEYIRSQNSEVSITVIPNGVDLNKFTTDGPHDSKTLITTGRLVKKNGITDLVAATALIKKRVPDIKLLILADGEQKEELKNKSILLGLEDNIEFLGEVSYDLVPQHLAKASIFVRPSLSEGLGNSFLEAMASGLAIIGTPVGGIPDFLKDGETGLFCRVGDPEDIAEKIRTILDDDNLRSRLILNGRKLVEERYSWDKIAAEFREQYNNVIPRPALAGRDPGPEGLGTI